MGIRTQGLCLISQHNTWTLHSHQHSRFLSNIRRSLQDEFREGRPKSVVVPETIEKLKNIAIVPLEHRRTVNSEWYTTICLPVVFQEIWKINRQRRITLHHDNASSNTSARTTAFLSTQNIDLMIHPPYSPHLGPNDIFLFPYVRNKMRDVDTYRAADAFRMHVLEVPQSEWQKCFDNWFKRIRKFRDLNGEYFETQ